jgi:hypothetical protein
MAKIQLTKSTYSVIPEGEHVFLISTAEYDEDFGKVTFEMVTASGQKHTEIFSLIKADGEINEGAHNAFSYFAKVALNDFNVDEIDPQDLVGCYMRCVVSHDVRPHKNDPNRTVTFVRLGDKFPADGFQNESKKTDGPKTKNEALAEQSAPASSGAIDLDAILGK